MSLFHPFLLIRPLRHFHTSCTVAHSTKHFVTTLNPQKLTDRDRIHLVGATYNYVHFNAHPPSHFLYEGKKRFPSHTRGFLYFNPGPAEHPAAGALRFRVTGEQGVAYFNDGHDLLTPRGDPWFIHLSRIARTARFQGIGCQLVDDGFVTQALLERLRVANPLRDWIHMIIHSVEESFLWDLSKSLNVCVARGDKLLPMRVYGLLGDRREGDETNYSPYRGVVRCRFEIVGTHPTHTSLAIRVLEVLKPVRLVAGKPGFTVLPPAENALITRDGHPILLRSDANTAYAPALQALAAEHARQSSLAIASPRLNKHPAVSTLDLARVRPSDFVDVTRRLACYHPSKRPHAIVDGARVPFSLYLNSQMQPGERRAFPMNGRGYLYFHWGDEQASAGIRFRVPDESAPPTSGHDLLAAPGTPWCIPAELLDLAPGSEYEGLARLALKEGFILANHAPVKGYRQITSLDEPFIAPFSRFAYLHTVRPGGEPTKHSLSMFADTRRFGGTRRYPLYPWTGSAVCRFEPAKPGAGLTQVCVRVLKILERPRCNVDGYDGYVPAPTEGGLATQGFGWRVWTHDFPKNPEIEIVKSNE